MMKISNDLQGHRAAQHHIADIVQEEEPHIIRVGVESKHRYPDGNATERDARHPPVSADGADAAAQLEPLPDHVREFVQNLGQIAARALLQQHRGNEEVHVQRRNALGQFLQRHVQRQAQIVFLEGAPEFTRQGFLKLAVNHFERHREGMPGAHRARHELQAVRKDLFEAAHARLAFADHIQQRKGASEQRGHIGKTPELVWKQDPGQRPDRHHRQQGGVHQPVRAPLHPGLLNHFLQLALQLETPQELGGEQDILFLGMNEGAPAAGGNLHRLAFAGADQPALELVQIGVAECIRADPPDDQGASPHRDGDHYKHGVKPPPPRRTSRPAAGCRPPAAFRRIWAGCRWRRSVPPRGRPGSGRAFRKRKCPAK